MPVYYAFVTHMDIARYFFLSVCFLERFLVEFVNITTIFMVYVLGL